MTRPLLLRTTRVLLLPVLLIVGVSACASGTSGSSTSGSSNSGTSSTSAVASPSEPSPAPSTQPPSAEPSSAAPASSAAGSPASSIAAVDLVGPCDLLTIDEIQAATGVAVPDGEETKDDVRKIQMCTWTATDPFLIVAASLTDVAAAEAFQTNVDLAPAYFDGDAALINVPGTDKAYSVQQPDVGWVVGAIAKGRFLQVQVGGDTVTEEQVISLVQDAVAQLPS
jgi:hypothetical protein